MEKQNTKIMGFTKVSWPESQLLMCLTEEEMEEFDIELGDDCSYFVPNDVYEEVMSIAEERY